MIHVLQLATDIDLALENKDKEKLLEFKEKLEELLNKKNIEVKASLCFFLGNIFDELKNFKQEENSSHWNYDQEEVFRMIYYYRRAILEPDFKSLLKEEKASIYTNLANAFMHYGRTIKAIEYFNKALEFSNDYYMTLINRGKAFRTYSNLIYDEMESGTLIHFAYKDQIKALKQVEAFLSNTENQDDKKHFTEAKNIILEEINQIESFVFKEFLISPLKLDKPLNYRTAERKYRNWVLKNKLFLNSINDIDSFEMANDDLFCLPDMENLNETKYLSYFQQIKQEFISNRALLFEGLHKKSEWHYQTDTYIQNFDYNIFSISNEKIKIAFKGFYSIFDKIAFFINEYFDLGKKENQVDFNKVWFSSNNKNLNKKFNDFENLSLRGLYLISKDFYFSYKNEDSKNFIEVLEPEAKEINDIRNHLEHKFLMIKEKSSNKFNDNYLTENQLKEKTVNLAKITREAVIYLSLAIYQEEERKFFGKREL
jgi:hypothetical protein